MKLVAAFLNNVELVPNPIMKNVIRAALVLVTTAAGPAAAALYDDFNDNSTNPAFWTVSNVGNGVTIAETNQRLEINLSADATNGSAGIFSGGYVTNTFQGDLDVWVDFQLLDWPSANGVRVGLSFGDSANFGNFWSIERVSAGRGEIYGDVYLTDFNGFIGTLYPTSDQSGALRLVRTGTTLSAYYLAGSQWQLMRSDTIIGADLVFMTAAWSHDQYFNDQPVKVAFDNVNVNAVPIPPAVWLFGSGLVGLVAVARRKSSVRKKYR
jgi:hypothetical protein